MSCHKIEINTSMLLSQHKIKRMCSGLLPRTNYTYLYLMVNKTKLHGEYSTIYFYLITKYFYYLIGFYEIEELKHITRSDSYILFIPFEQSSSTEEIQYASPWSVSPLFSSIFSSSFDVSCSFFFFLDFLDLPKKNERNTWDNTKRTQYNVFKRNSA